jgi:hypothetical protein
MFAACLPGGGIDQDTAGIQPVTPTSQVSFSLLPGEARAENRWNGRVFTQDALWTHNSQQYAVWVSSAGNPIAGRRGLNDGSGWETNDLSKVSGNPLGAPTDPDEHNVYVIAVDKTGYIHIVGNVHNQPLRYIRSAESEDITAWKASRMIGTEESSVTYPIFVQRRNGALLFFYRQGSSGRGDVYLNTRSEQGWIRTGKVIDGRSSDESAYLHHVAVDNLDRIHLMFVWRGTGDPDSNNDLSYARSPDGGKTWGRADGSPLATPITHQRAEVVIDTPGSGSGLSNSGGLETDLSQQPHATVLLDRGGRPAVWHVWYRDGWKKRPVESAEGAPMRSSVVSSPSGQMWMLASSPSGAYLLELKPGGRDEDPLILANGQLGGWELPIDTQGLYRRGDVNTFLPVRGPDGTARLGVATVRLSDAG